jgi:hypothetical protein
MVILKRHLLIIKIVLCHFDGKTALCGIASLQSRIIDWKTGFLSSLSVQRFPEFAAVNYDKWDNCFRLKYLFINLSKKRWLENEDWYELETVAEEIKTIQNR